MIDFKAELSQIGTLKIIRMPLNISEQLSSRGMLMVQGKIDNTSFKTKLEPDGKGSHWIEVNPLLIEKIGIKVGDFANLSIEEMKDWTKPDIPEDIMNSIIKDDLLEEWNSITIKAQWDWIRWIRSTENTETRNKRINVTCSKLKNGDRRPCCFDRTRCTVTSVCKSGLLLD